MQLNTSLGPEEHESYIILKIEHSLLAKVLKKQEVYGKEENHAMRIDV